MGSEAGIGMEYMEDIDLGIGVELFYSCVNGIHELDWTGPFVLLI